MIDLIGTTLGRYRIEALLGRGGMAQVYRALDTVLGRTVAVKIIQPALSLDGEEFSERFLREARLVASLEHPHLLPVYDFGEQDGRPFLVMPCVEGGTLSERMVDGAVEPERAARWVAELGAALDAAHTAGVLHRDVKPSNILVASDDRVILADFGISRMSESSTRLTLTGQVVGTPVYMAPELVLGEPASPASDLYALAVLAYELLAGTPPYRGDNPLAVLHQHAREPIPAVTSHTQDLPAAVDSFFDRALAKSPAQRPPTGAALAGQLSSALAGTFHPIDLVKPVETDGPEAMPVSGAGEPGSSSKAATEASEASRSQDATATRVLPPRESDGGEAPDPPTTSPLRDRAIPGLLILLVIVVVSVLAVRQIGPGQPERSGQEVLLSDALEVASGSADVDLPLAAGDPRAGERSAEAAGTKPGLEPGVGQANEGGKDPAKEPGASEPDSDSESSGSVENAPDFVPTSGSPEALNLPRMLEAVRRFQPMSEQRFRTFWDQIGSVSEDRLNDDRFSTFWHWARGGLAFSQGDAETAEASARALLRSPQARAMLSILSVESSMPQTADLPEWALAAIYRDPLGTGASLVDAELRSRPNEARLLLAQAWFEALHGDPESAVEHAAAVFEQVPSSDSEARSSIAFFAGQQFVAAGKSTEAMEWFRRSFDAGGSVGPLAALEAGRLAARAGEQQVASTLFQKACQAGLRAACREVERPRPARPFRRPNG